MPADELRRAALFALAVILCLVLVRMAWVLAYDRLAQRYASGRGAEPPPTKAEAILIGWCGMRGLITLVTAFALPADFPQRDLIVLRPPSPWSSRHWSSRAFPFLERIFASS